MCYSRKWLYRVFPKVMCKLTAYRGNTATAITIVIIFIVTIIFIIINATTANANT